MAKTPFSAGEIIEIPAFIDVHVHAREPGGEEKETIESATHAAAAGGYQAVFDMPNNPNKNETWTLAKLTEKEQIAKVTALTDIGFYAGVNLSDRDNTYADLVEMAPRASGLKLYMGPTTGNTETHDLDVARPAIDHWMAATLGKEAVAPILLHARDTIGAETAEYILSNGGKVHWCHVASTEEVVAARALKQAYPERFFAGVTPHHLTMTDRNANFQQGWNGARMQPPLGKEVDAEALLAAYNDGILGILETDHAPHTHNDKVKAERENPEGHTEADCTTCYGVSGIEFLLPVMMSLVQRKIITLERLIESLHEEPMKMLDLKPAAMPQTIRAEVSPYVIGEDDFAGKSRNTPYVGWTGWAKVLDVQHARSPRILRAGSQLSTQ